MLNPDFDLLGYQQVNILQQVTAYVKMSIVASLVVQTGQGLIDAYMFKFVHFGVYQNNFIFLFVFY